MAVLRLSHGVLPLLYDCDKSACEPNAVFFEAVVLDARLLEPLAVLYEPVVLASRLR